jgi:hypothetical protein
MTDDFLIFLQLGLEHITDPNGYDHILFIAAMCSMLSFEAWRKLLFTVTAFTIGHSVSLTLAVLGYSPFDASLIEFLIPVTIILTCLFNLAKPERKDEQQINLYSLVLFFGLIHGLGFANYLKSLLGKGGNLFVPLLSFNIGLEIGQLIIAAFVLVLILFFQKINFSRRETVIFLNAFVTGIALTILQKVWIF